MSTVSTLKAPKMAQDGPRWPQEPPKRRPGGAMRAFKASKRAQDGPQDGLPNPQDGLQDGPRWPNTADTVTGYMGM